MRQNIVNTCLTSFYGVEAIKRHDRHAVVQAPVFDHIAVRVGEMISSRRPVCIIVPSGDSFGRGQTWWPRMEQFSAARLSLGRVEDVVQDRSEYAGHNWRMEAHVLIPELREKPKAKGKRDAVRSTGSG